jgi:ABC-type bacteriocin/lantibiotic exporters, contain an N-terminal double-glycine peptidase domain
LPSEREPKHNSATVPSNWPEQGAITLDNYSVKYRENLPKVLKSLSIKIRGNEKVRLEIEILSK